MRRQPLIIVGIASVASLAVLLGAALARGQQGGPVCEVQRTATLSEAALAASSISAGEGIVATDGDYLVSTTTTTGTQDAYQAPSAEDGLLRHVASSSGRGTAYVVDRLGPDELVVVTPGGTTEIPAAGEATHPAWSPDGKLAWASDLSSIEVRKDGRSIASFPAPPPAELAFSPVFTSNSRLVVVGGDVGDTAESENVDNLWRYDLIRRSWKQLTAFQVGSGAWSLIRTPITGADGSVLFVRVHGYEFQEGPPAYELWQVKGDRTTMLQTLPGERYLAGRLDGTVVWNVDLGDRWGLTREGGQPIGCGSVMVDPRGYVDPDVQEVPEPPPPSEPPCIPAVCRRVVPPNLGSGHGADAEDLAILVGDFDTTREAEAMRDGLGAETLRVVSHRSAPLAVAPGAWGVALPLAVGDDPETSLREFRARFPGLEDRTWIVSLAGGIG